MSGDDTLQVVGDDASGSVSIDDIRTVVDDAARAGVDATNSKYDALHQQLVVLGDSVALLAASDDAATDAEDGVQVYTVRLAPEQVDRAMAGFRVLCTEGLLLMVLVGVLCGLLGWHIFSGRWGYHG